MEVIQKMEISEHLRSILQKNVESIGLKFEKYQKDINKLNEDSSAFQKTLQFIEEQDTRLQKQIGNLNL